ncbi:MAG: glycoside hydrolase family 3 C-terminal domain-containing protein [Erysipelotrichaceae bacterium]|nr:glycoside hydrolase family 3 C-terminal domain-containing protein [Erysipelotrichaceae bacterium]
MSDTAMEILKKLSLSEKAALINGADFWHSADLSPYGLKKLTFSDGPHGLRFQAGEADHLGLFKASQSVCFPCASALANSWNQNLAQKTGESLSEQAAAVQVDVLLGPGLNLIDNPKCGRSFEYYSEDPYLSGVMAGYYAKGLESRVSSCLKHFALNRQETNRQCIDEVCDLQTFMNLYAYGFKKAIEIANPGWIMSAYNRINGIFANEHPALLQDVLRDQLHFKGAVVSDWGGGNDSARGIAAGCSVEMPGTFGAVSREVLQAVENGTLKEEDLDQRVLEVLNAMEAAAKKRNDPVRTDLDKVHAGGLEAAYEAACESMVLLKNKEGALPLNPERKTAFIGPFGSDFPMQGGGSSRVEPLPAEDFRSLLNHKEFKNALYVPAFGRDLRSSPVLRRQALKALEESDTAVILLCYPDQETLEGIDRVCFDLPLIQKWLIEKAKSMNKTVILADAISGPKADPALDQADAIVHMGLAGAKSREALLDLLKGDINPSGKLAQTWALAWEDYPSSRRYPAQGPQSRRTVSLPSYSWMLSRRIPVKYPFGFGLSYSDFKVTGIRRNNRTLSMEIENLSERDGAEVIELFVSRDDEEAVLLKGFKKVFLKGHEKRKIEMELDPDAFQIWSEKDQAWNERKGRWKVQVTRNGLQTVDGVVFFDVQSDSRTIGSPVDWPGEAKRQDQWNLDLTSPFSSFVRADNPWIRLTAGFLKAASAFSLKINRPNTVLLALRDIPLKSLAKTSASLVDRETAGRILKTAGDCRPGAFGKLLGFLLTHQIQKN